MEVALSAVASRLGTETAFEVLSRAKALERQGRHVVHLEIGEPDFNTPPHVVDAAARALREGHTHYTPSAGIPELREAVARYVARTRGIPVDPSEVVVTPGAKPVMAFTVLALVDAGDEVVYPDPGFPIYESLVRWVGGVPRPLRLREERGFRVDPEELASLVGPRTKLVILNSPHNPCGSVLSREEVDAIAEVCLRHRAWVLSDEIYSRILYDAEHHSIAARPGMRERTVILDGFSKTYAMTGWRLGYGVMPVRLAEAVTRFAVNVHSCPAAFTQVAGVAALEGPQEPVEAMVAEFRRRRDRVVQGLNAIEGIRCTTPQGAFYAFPNVSQLDPEGRAFADYLLEEAGVAVLSGTAFGEGGRGYLRISYATSLQNLELALDRIATAARSFRRR
ncbi:MAG: pyridoxal phosphate-dependent aminotransferase [Armatimonadota bacterium]|nr:pyridoxal phosphate-dependent aminotransferase [Armatimonadota bacterium]MDW8157187.1 pyridoxal phosphate-dependent aminotransferase [Armatimonadota bacterium]